MRNGEKKPPEWRGKTGKRYCVFTFGEYLKIFTESRTVRGDDSETTMMRPDRVVGTVCIVL